MLAGLESPWKCFIKINFLSKDHGLLSIIDVKCSSEPKIAIKRFCPTSLMVTPLLERQRLPQVALNTSLLKSLLVYNLNKILYYACYLEPATSEAFTIVTPFSSFESLKCFQSSSIDSSMMNKLKKKNVGANTIIMEITQRETE